MAEPTLAAMDREAFEKLIAENDEVRMLVELRASDMFLSHRHLAGCYDCGLCYGSEGWIECIVPDDVWQEISPTHDDGGILCITCIARRLKRLGREGVLVMLCGTESIKVAGQDEAFWRGWNAAKERIDELEAELSQRDSAASSPSEPKNG